MCESVREGERERGRERESVCVCVEDVLKFRELNLRLLSRFVKLVYQKMC